MFGNSKEAYVLDICHSFSAITALTYKGEASERITKHNEARVMNYTDVIGERESRY